MSSSPFCSLVDWKTGRAFLNEFSHELLSGVLFTLLACYLFLFIKKHVKQLQKYAQKRRALWRELLRRVCWLLLLDALNRLHRYIGAHTHQKLAAHTLWPVVKQFEQVFFVFKVASVFISLRIFYLLVKLFFVYLNQTLPRSYRELGILQVFESIAQLLVFLFGLAELTDKLLGYKNTELHKSLPLGAATITGVVAFASKDLIANFFGALVVLAGRPFKINDWIIIQGIEGRVKHISMRSTQLITKEGVVHHLPNSLFLSKDLQNYGSGRPIYLRFTLEKQHSNQSINLKQFMASVDQLVLSEKQVDNAHALTTDALPNQPLAMNWYVKVYQPKLALRLLLLEQLTQAVGVCAHQAGAKISWVKAGAH